MARNRIEPCTRTGERSPGEPEVQPLANGTRLRLRVRPGAGKDAVVGVHDGALRVSVVAPPERGKANRALVKLLARVLGVAPKDVELLSGETSRDKSVRIALPPEDVLTRLRR